MTLNFVEKMFCINGNGTEVPTLQFYKRGFLLGGGGSTPTWRDVILSGNTALTLVNAKADGLNYLKLFGECELRNLPLGYTQLDWIEGDDGVYIDTGITPSCNVLRVKWKGQIVGSSYSGSFIGCVGGTSPRAGFRIFSNTNTGALNIQSYSSLLAPGYQSTDVNTVDVTYDNVNKTITGYCNSTVINETNANIDTNFNKNMLLFGAYIGDTLGVALASKCWGLLVEKDGVLVLNYIPAKRNSDNAIGMYDTVTNTFLTNAGTGNFVAGGAVVPSIDNPVDIICNNGKLAIKNKYLPLEYEEVNGLTGDGSAYINLDTGLNQNDEIEIKFSIASTTAKEGLLGSRANANTQNIAVAFANNPNSEVVADFNNSNYANYRLQQSLTPNIIYTLKINKNRRAIYNGATLVAQNATVCNDTITVSNCFLFAIAGYPAYSDRFTGTIYSCKIKNKRNVIPCRRKSDNVLGMYDTVTGTFFTNVDTNNSNFTAGAVVVNDYELYVDGITETVEDSLGNTATAENLLSVDIYKDEQEVLTGQVTYKTMTYVVDGTEDWDKYRANNGYSCFRISSGLGLRSKHRIGISNYLPYYNVTTASLDREAFTIGSNMTAFYITLADEDMTLEEFTDWLKGLCKAGRPFIVVLPRYTTVTETVTPQTLTTQAGTNIIEITQASIDGLPLEVSYKAGVTVTVEEVENANLDDSVTVTIGE